MSDRTRLLILQIVVILCVCAFLFFFGLGAFGLVGADEPRYAQIAREMLERHDWIVPTLNQTPWLEKPVLLYWKVINSYRIFGVYDWAARVPAAGHAVVLVLAVFFFMRRFRLGSELDGALIAASCPGVFVFARGASTDMLLAAHFALAMLAWWAWHQTEEKSWLACFYAFLALATLAKGPVAPGLALLIVGTYATLRHEGKILLRSLSWLGFGLFFAITLPWYIAIQMREPQFFRVFFIQHNLERFGTSLYRHPQPLWFYIPWFLVWVLPWLAFMVPALIEAVGDGIPAIRAKVVAAAASPSSGDEAASSTEAVRVKLSLFLLVWIAVPIVFFSISRSKLPGYILPAIPPAALLTADYLHRRRTVSRWQLMLHSLVCGLILGSALLAPWLIQKEPVTQVARAIITLSTGAIAILVLVMVRRRGLAVLHFATLLPVILALALLLRRPIAPLVDAAFSARPVEAKLRELGLEQTSLALFDVKRQRELAYGLNFYRNRPIAYYEGEGPRDLPHGIPAEEHVVVTKAGNSEAVQAAVGQRKIKALGAFPLRHLEFFLVSNTK